jgi:hypothetical protein
MTSKLKMWTSDLDSSHFWWLEAVWKQRRKKKKKKKTIFSMIAILLLYHHWFQYSIGWDVRWRRNDPCLALQKVELRSSKKNDFATIKILLHVHYIYQRLATIQIIGGIKSTWSYCTKKKNGKKWWKSIPDVTRWLTISHLVFLSFQIVVEFFSIT